MRTMLQALLADRFQLKVHRETREVPMYALVVAKNGAKLQESSVDDQPRGSTTGDGSGMHMDIARGTMTQLANRLSVNGAGRPVLDRTGLTGIYTFKLNWVNAVASVSDSALPPLDLALQEQLGLRLESIKGPLEILVIDHAEKPTAN
jgi:bla regulator protein BlaR1